MLVCVAEDSCEQESLKIKTENEKVKTQAEKKKKTKCFLNINDNLNVWEFNSLEASERVLTLMLVGLYI